MRLTKVQVAEGTRVPWGYGFAWRNFDMNATVAYPIPFNVLLRGLRRFWHWIVGGYKNSVIDEAQAAGRRVGEENARHYWRIQLEVEVARRMKVLEAEFDQRVIEKADWALKQAMRTDTEDV